MLSDREQSLEELEEKITSGVWQFRTTGQALNVTLKKQQHRKTHSSFGGWLSDHYAQLLSQESGKGLTPGDPMPDVLNIRGSLADSRRSCP